MKKLTKADADLISGFAANFVNAIRGDAKKNIKPVDANTQFVSSDSSYIIYLSEQCPTALRWSRTSGRMEMNRDLISVYCDELLYFLVVFACIKETDEDPDSEGSTKMYLNADAGALKITMENLKKFSAKKFFEDFSKLLSIKSALTDLTEKRSAQVSKILGL